jgi:hypothetical protein
MPLVDKVCFSIIELGHLLIAFLLQQRWLLEVIKDVVLAQLSQKFPSQVSFHMKFLDRLTALLTEAILLFVHYFAQWH